MSDNTEKTSEDIFAELMGADVPQKAPEPAPGSEIPETTADTAAPETDPTPEPETASTDSPVPDLPEEVKQKLARLAEVEDHFTKLQRDYQAVHGRLAPMQRKLAEYEHAAKASPQANAKPSQSAESSTGKPLQDQLKQIEEDYPEIASAIKAERERLEALDQRLGQMQAAFEPVARQIGHQTGVQRLTHVHPDWQEINGSEHFNGFLDWWWNNQPPAFRAAIGGDEGFEKSLNDADFVIPLLTQYKAIGRQPAAPPEPAQPAQNPKPSAQTGRRAISAAPNVRSSGMPPAVDMRNLPEEDQFAILWAQAGSR